MLPRPSPPLRALLAGLLAIMLAAGCGSSSSSSTDGLEGKSPDEIVASARNAAASAATVHIDGSIVSEGKPISLNMELVRGKGASGRITLEGLSIDIIELEQAVYIKGSQAFYEHVAGPNAAALLQGKWLKAPSGSGNFSSLTQLTDLNRLLGAALTEHGSLAHAGSTTIEGQKAVGVKDTVKGGVLYVAATGTPYPLEIQKTSGEGGTIRFDRWNQPVTLTAPAGAINITQLQNGH